jgi:uncharacterized spore protein YtfJ
VFRGSKKGGSMFEKKLQNLSETLGKGMKISLVFGEPIEAQGKTIIPVSKVTGGFGGGEGITPDFVVKDDSEDSVKDIEKKDRRGHGVGGGGGLHNEAVGVFEVSADYTRFIPAVQFRHILVLVGMIMGFVWKMSRRRKKK